MPDYGSCFNIAHIEPESEIYGPGRRFVIWLQGCSLACPGCWNKEMWSFEPKHLVERDILLSDILSYPGLEGVTLLGGEPLQQASNVHWLLSNLKDRNIGIMLYTGYELEEIFVNPTLSHICNLADILIAGRYHEEERYLFLRWRGSRNQSITLLTDRYSDLQLEDNLNEVELTIDEHGRITLLGYPIDKNEIFPNS